MKPGQKLSPEGVRAAVAAAVAASGRSQTDLAGALGVSQAAVSRATREANTSLIGLQRRLLETLAGVTLAPEPEVLYTVERVRA